MFFMCTGKPKNLCDLLYGGDSLRAVVWDRTHYKYLQGVPVIPSPNAEDHLRHTSNSLAESQSFFPPPSSLFIQTPHDFDKPTPREEQGALLIQMLISSGNTLTDTSL